MGGHPHRLRGLAAGQLVPAAFVIAFVVLVWRDYLDSRPAGIACLRARGDDVRWGYVTDAWMAVLIGVAVVVLIVIWVVGVLVGSPFMVGARTPARSLRRGLAIGTVIAVTQIVVVGVGTAWLLTRDTPVSAEEAAAIAGCSPGEDT